MKKFLLAAGYAVGNYFVDFALKRGEDLRERFDGLTLHAKKFSSAERFEETL